MQKGSILYSDLVHRMSWSRIKLARCYLKDFGNSLNRRTKYILQSCGTHFCVSPGSPLLYFYFWVSIYCTTLIISRTRTLLHFRLSINKCANVLISQSLLCLCNICTLLVLSFAFQKLYQCSHLRELLFVLISSFDTSTISLYIFEGTVLFPNFWYCTTFHLSLALFCFSI